MEVLNDNPYYQALLVARQPPRKRTKFVEKQGLPYKIHEASKKNMTVLESDEEIVCVVRPEAGSAYPTMNIKKLMKTTKGKKFSLVGTEENHVRATTSATGADGIIFTGLIT